MIRAKSRGPIRLGARRAGREKRRVTQMVIAGHERARNVRAGIRAAAFDCSTAMASAAHAEVQMVRIGIASRTRRIRLGIFLPALPIVTKDVPTSWRRAVVAFVRHAFAVHAMRHERRVLVLANGAGWRNGAKWLIGSGRPGVACGENRQTPIVYRARAQRHQCCAYGEQGIKFHCWAIPFYGSTSRPVSHPGRRLFNDLRRAAMMRSLMPQRKGLDVANLQK
jgi:hypothetical protein